MLLGVLGAGGDKEGYMPRKESDGQAPKRRVRFSIEAPGAKEVSLAGTFNGWEARSRLLKRDERGVWSTSLTLTPGTYEYRFLVDGEWQNAPGAEVAPNPYGTQNCVRVVL
jgi:1,4-alpha-glucan branching enzyme